MKRRVIPLLGGLAVVMFGCAPTTPDPSPPDPDCVAEVMRAEGCTGCHLEVSPAAGLDLASPELGARMIGASAATVSCQGRLLIDPARPERSLLLQAIGAVNPPGGDDDACQIVMPPERAGQADIALRACLTDWVFAIAAAQPPPTPFVPTPAEAAVAKVKALVDGEAPTADEVARVAADPAALRDMLERWTDLDANPRFRNKLAGFLAVALQQRVPIVTDDQFDRLQANRIFAPSIRRVLEESFVRTAVDIVERGAPFTEVLTTRRWMLTTANLVYLRYVEQTGAERRGRHQIVPSVPGQDPSLEQQVADRTWVVPGYVAGQGACARGMPQANVLDLMHGFVNNQCSGGQALRWDTGPLSAADFEDWRMVELSTEVGAPIPFYDVPALRAVDQTLRIDLPRSGYFTTTAFFANWATNVDNQFRVTTNQTVLTALHAGFSQTEPTPRATADDAAIPIEHVESTDTACYGCHKNMDPMRVYFAASYNARYQRPFGPVGSDGGPIYDPMPEAGFGLLGQSELGVDVTDLGRTLAAHPRFAIGWTQKICLFANSARCDEDDPVFVRIADRFRANPDLRALIVDVLSSPLVTGLEETTTWGSDGPLVSITRRSHLCAMLDARVGVDGLCELRRVAPLIGLVPDDSFARGVADPVQPTLPSAFHYAAARTACEAIAQVAVSARSAFFAGGDIDGAMTVMVERLMGLTEGHPRRATAIAELRAHFDAALDAGFGAQDGVRAAFALACLSPDMMGMGL